MYTLVALSSNYISIRFLLLNQLINAHTVWPHECFLGGSIRHALANNRRVKIIIITRGGGRITGSWKHGARAGLRGSIQSWFWPLPNYVFFLEKKQQNVPFTSWSISLFGLAASYPNSLVRRHKRALIVNEVGVCVSRHEVDLVIIMYADSISEVAIEALRIKIAHSPARQNSCPPPPPVFFFFPISPLINCSIFFVILY